MADGRIAHTASFRKLLLAQSRLFTYVLKDSTYAVQKCTMNLPKKSGVNFVNRMDITQQYEQLPTGNWYWRMMT